MTIDTTDGATITTVEQEGPNAGYEIGRVWIKHPTVGCSHWTWTGFGDVDKSRAAVGLCKGLTLDEAEEAIENARP